MTTFIILIILNSTFFYLVDFSTTLSHLYYVLADFHVFTESSGQN